MVAAGRQALAAQDFATSLERLEQAYVLAPSPDLLYELGQVARGQGRTLAAVDLLRRYLEEAHRFMDPAGQREAEALIAAPRKASGEVAVARERGALLWLDDSWRAPCPYHCLCW